MADAVTAPALTKGERTRLRLLEAAERVFGEKGYHEASVTDITREAEVANGTFYVYFPSKADLFVELVRTRGHEMRALLHEATKDLEKRADIERAGLRAWLRWVQQHPSIYRIVRNGEFVDTEVFQEWYRRLGAAYSRGLRRAIDAGEIVDADPDVLAYCLMAIGDFVGMRWVLWEDGRDVSDDVFEAVMGFMLRGLGAEGGTRGGRAQRRR